MLVLAISEYLDKLLQDGSLAPCTSLRETRRIVVMAIHVALMLVVAILCSKDCWADGAGEMLNVVLAIQRGNIRASKGTAACEAQKI